MSISGYIIRQVQETPALWCTDEYKIVRTMKNREEYYMEPDFIETWQEMEHSIFQNNRKRLDRALSGYWYDIVNAGRYYLKED